ncbi:MAG: ribonuclease Y [candidate division Zixibacteria bacterium]|nr:ribonuclease Y [candidate division Zixibacteria bacterium]
MAELPTWLVIAAFVVDALIFALAGWLLARKIGRDKISRADEAATQIIREAEKEAEIKKKEALLEAKDEWYKQKVNFERELQVKRSELQKEEKSLSERDDELNRRVDMVQTKEKEIQNREKALTVKERALRGREGELDRLISDQNRQLERIAGMSTEEAKRQLMDNLEAQVRREAAARAKEILDDAERNAEKEAREIITRAVHRVAAEHTVETTVAVVSLPSDDMKGRIIGREGRNIRSFETATGVDVVVDDTPEAVILSAFDPVRREIARMALEKLVADGRIHPARIEEVVDKAEKEMEIILRDAGEQACFDVGIHNLHRDIVWLLGKLHFRTSYGQNVLAHIVEVAQLCGIMASELGLDTALAKRCGLLHDIGKAIDRDTEGTHIEIGVNFLKKYNENAIVLNAVEAHHGDVPPESPYPILVMAADGVSGARPGARREPLEGYVKRLEKLEEIADGFAGVAKAYAIQAGREIRVIVENENVDDAGATLLANDIANKIQADLEYPGQIKVTVIRETRAIEYAK